jgi:hypothetical protein
MQCIGGEAHELRVSRVKQRLVVASFHINLRLRIDASIDDDV